ncbi:hotdog family protein [Pseudoxanthomonas dokdonensis]|nr:hotdog family protein [Pseudoxanthomonas dokdonensis]
MHEISHYLPHRGTMLLIDRLLEWQEDHVVAELRVPASGPFHEDEGVPAWVGIEYMAQTIAAWSGNRARNAGDVPGIGFLLGSRRYLAHVQYFRAGAVLTVEARRELMGDNGLGMFACRILEQGTEIASANVSVFEPPDPMAYLENSKQPAQPHQGYRI